VSKWARRVDANQLAIVRALEQVGCSVQNLSRVGQGCPDLMVARGGNIYLMEVKTAKGTLTPDQIEWMNEWKSYVHVVTDPIGALRAVGVMAYPKTPA